MIRKQYISENAALTVKIGKSLAKQLVGGDIIGLSGDLGGGKTTFVKGIAKSLGIVKNIVSPTFIFGKIYPLNKHGIKFLCHFDLYRINKPGDLSGLGLEEYWKRKDAICLIEWPEKIKSRLPKNNFIAVEFQMLGQNKRKITITRPSKE